MADMILRAAAIEAFDDERVDRNYGDVSPESVIEVIKSIPAVDAAPVIHAQPVWINPLDPEAKVCIWKCSSLCSVCGDYVVESWNYCPNCGAKMDGERRDNI